MINIRFIISTLLLIAVGITAPSFAGEYKVLVLPNSSIDLTKKNTIGSVDIEELLTKKIISKLEETGMACAPTMDILKISILNNPYFVPKAPNPINNAKIISDSYNVPKVIIVSSKVTVKTPAQQKEFWNTLNIPAISQTEANLQLITTVSMYDMKTEQVLWTDVYRQNLNRASEGIKANKLTEVNSYYDRLTDKLISDLKTTKSTSAILISNKLPEWGKPANNTKTTPLKTTELTQQKTTSLPETTNIKLSKEPKESYTNRLKSALKNKYTEYKKAQEKKQIEKAEKLIANTNKTNNENKILTEKTTGKKQINKEKNDLKIKTSEPKISIKTDKKNIKNNPKISENKQIKFTEKITETVDKTKQNITSYIKKRNDEKQIKISKEKPKQITKKEEKITQKTPEQNNKNSKKSGITLGEKIKKKYLALKQSCKDMRTSKITPEENAHHYTTVTSPITNAEPNVNGYIQAKPRNNSWNYVPHFNSLVNDL